MRNGPEGPYYREKKYPRCWQKRVASFRCIKTRRPNMSDRSLYKREKKTTLFQKKKILKNGCTVRMNLSKASMIHCYCSFCVFFFFIFLFCKKCLPIHAFQRGHSDGSSVAFNSRKRKEKGRKEKEEERKRGVVTSFDFHLFLSSRRGTHFLLAWKLLVLERRERGGERKKKETREKRDATIRRTVRAFW